MPGRLRPPATAGALALLLAVSSTAMPAGAQARTSGSGGSAAFFSPGHVQKTRTNLRGGGFQRPGSGLGSRPADDGDVGAAPRRGEARRTTAPVRVARPVFLHSDGFRFRNAAAAAAVLEQERRRSEELARAARAARNEAELAREAAALALDVARLRGEEDGEPHEDADASGEADRADPALDDLAGRIGRLLQEPTASGPAPTAAAAGADRGPCVRVEIRTTRGIGIHRHLPAASLDARGVEQVASALRRRFARGLPLVLPGDDAPLSIAPDRLASLLVGPCR